LATPFREGASAFLRREYVALVPFIVVVAVILGVFIDWLTLGSAVPGTAISYLAGTFCSALAGFVGMSVAVRANVRTAAAAMRGLNPALQVAFSSGSVMGITVVGIGLLGVTILYWIFQDITAVAGFGFGASSIALFARVGGGIYTKAADVGTDLVGKVEAGIPEDDPRNPGVIADNVGDNVGDVAGMGADLFESYVGSIISAIALAVAGTQVLWDDNQAVLPLLLSGAGILAAILGTFLVRSGEQADFGQLLWALRRGIFAAAALLAVFALIIVLALDLDFNWFWTILAGLLAGIVISLATEYYTSYDYTPTRQVSESSQTGAATVIISGIATGMLSTVIPVVAIGITILVAFELAGFYGVALAGVGLLSTLGITLATDTYGPVADNAGGIAQQAQLAPEVRQRTDALDALGNNHCSYRERVCYWLSGADFSGAAGSLRRSLRAAPGANRHGWNKSAQPYHSGGPAHWGHVAFPFLGFHYESRGPGGFFYRKRSAPPVSRNSRDYGWQWPPGLRALHGYQHPGRIAGDDCPGTAGGKCAARRWLYSGDRGVGWSAYWLSGGRVYAGYHDGKRWRSLGQRQEVCGAGQLRRKRLGSPQSRC
jgi:Inorganic H+ pyrophosphatase